MSIITPSAPRYKSKFIGDKLQIMLPAQRRWYLVLFLLVWLMGWIVGEVLVGGMLLRSLFALLTGSPSGAGFPGLFMAVWLAMWTVGGAFAIYALVWQIAGKERIVIDNEALTVYREVRSWSRTKIYQKKHLLNLRVSPESIGYNSFKAGLRFWGIGGGVLAFDYGAKTIRFGSGMEEAEANMVVAEIRQYFPLYKPT